MINSFLFNNEIKDDDHYGDGDNDDIHNNSDDRNGGGGSKTSPSFSLNKFDVNFSSFSISLSVSVSSIIFHSKPDNYEGRIFVL